MHRRIAHQILYRFPGWLLATTLVLVGLALAAAQLWPAVKRWDEIQRDRVLSIVTEPLFWVGTIVVVVAWLYATWRFWPARENVTKHGILATGANHTFNIHYYRDVVVAEVAAVSQLDAVPVPTPSLTVSPSQITPSEEPPILPGTLEPLTLEATGVTFPAGLYVGAVVVSAGKLAEEGALEIAVRAHNGTGHGLRVVGVEGAINVREATGDGPFALPLPAFRPDQREIAPYVEFVLVLEQRVPPSVMQLLQERISQNDLGLDLRALNIMLERIDRFESRGRLPLWDGVRVWKRDDLTTGRMFILSAETGRFVVTGGAATINVTRADGSVETYPG